MVRIIRPMSDDQQKPPSHRDPSGKPIDDLKEGLGLLFRAAKGAAQKLPTDKVEDVAKDAVKEVGRAFETLGNEIDKVWNRATGSHGQPGHPGQPPPPAGPKPEEGKEGAPNPDGPPEAKKEPPRYDDAYAPDAPPKGPRVG
jgi:hypothetical protein